MPEAYTVKFSNPNGDDQGERETWSKDGVLHNARGPAVTVRNWSGVAVLQEYYHEGRLHRLDGPARIEEDETWRRVTCFAEGWEHSASGPSYQELHKPTGLITEERWLRHGRPHRHDGPAFIARDPQTGIAVSEAWSINGAHHRENGPAVIQRHRETGIVIGESWHRNGEHCRVGGPAIVCRDWRNGRISHQQFIPPRAARAAPEREP